MQTTIQDLNQFHLVWINTITSETGEGTFIFTEPADARDSIAIMRDQFPHCEIWLEDREHNKIEIPKR